MSVKAVHLTKDEFRATKQPGSFFVTEPGSDREQFFWYRCPCGCGRQGALSVGNGFKPADPPSWLWDGSLEAPTLTPSIDHRGHWHGWLISGEWKVC